ncbi:FtsK/SpoIIIE domain-containing protein, partial [Demequina sp. B12]|uniref:FtsK/SpoIIIE domain-containing protein n=1 Tax=Demequina sp. B12 TaxID=2992757 RepID=UPI00237A3E13
MSAASGSAAADADRVGAKSVEARILTHLGITAAALIMGALMVRTGRGGWLVMAPVALAVAVVEVHVIATVAGFRFQWGSWAEYRRSWSTPRQVRSVVAGWDAAARAAGLTGGDARKSAPVIALAVKVPRGVVLHFTTPAHSSLDTALHGAAPALSQHFSCPVEVGNAEGSTTVTVVHFDPNAVARRRRSQTTSRKDATDDSADDPRGLAIGRDSSGANVTWTLTGLVHILVQGITRSGKSSALYVFLTALAGRRDTIIVGIDPTGVLLAPLQDVTPTPPVDADPPVSALSQQFLTDTNVTGEGTARWLESMCEVMDRRIAGLRSRGLDKFGPTDDSVPVIVVVIDELPAVLARAVSEDRVNGSRSRTHPRIVSALGRIAREGAKANIQILATAQRFDASILGGDVRANFATRITFRVDNADAVRMLHPDADA